MGVSDLYSIPSEQFSAISWDSTATSISFLTDLTTDISVRCQDDDDDVRSVLYQRA
jgi:hypothetical protein